MERSKQSNEILDIIKASECFSMGGYGLNELALTELDKKIAEYESNKHYIELGKATKWLLEEWKYKMALAEFDQVDCTEGGVCITDADSLIDLYEGCKESEEYI